MLKSKKASLTFDFNKLRRHIVFVCIGIIIFSVSAIVPFFLEHPRSRDDRTDGLILTALRCAIANSGFF
ncbi:hypothetical protein [Microcoleus sp. K4-C2]|uniref:hypothetical protein n=1 Tax=Microcoleus sp. K4-C2 TaxID=2818792 RepID=UPI002FCF915C